VSEPPSTSPTDPTQKRPEPTLQDVNAGETHPTSGATRASPALLPPEVRDALPSAHFGKFVRVEKLGQGGMGEVWKAWDMELQRWVALKFLLGGDDDEVGRFQREARLAGGLAHPNIAAIHEVGQAQGRHFIAMQFVAGQTLKTFPRGDRRTLVSLVRDAALAAHVAHEQGIVHRDIKPENLMAVTSPQGSGPASPHLYVMDFGLARATEGAGTLSLSGSIVGTPAYMSPEQARGLRVDARADVWSLGATLYELLSGQKPFPGASVPAVLKSVCDDDPAPLRRIDGTIDRDLETIVRKSLEKEPSRRYATAGALAADLARWLGGAPIEARPPGAWERLARLTSRRRGVLLAAGAGLLLAAIVGGVLWRRLGAESARRSEKERQVEAEGRARVPLDAGRRVLDQMRAIRRDPGPKKKALLDLVARARAEFEKALAFVPDHPEALVGIGRAYEIADERAQAMPWFDHAASTTPPFAPALLERVRIAVWRLVDLEHRSEGQPGGASPESEALRARVLADLELARLHAREDSDVDYARALLAFTSGEYASAERQMAALLAVTPADATLHMVRGHALIHLKRHPEAVAEYDAALRYLADSPSALCGRALARLESGDVAGAKGDFERAIAGQPAYADAWMNLGTIHQQEGDLTRAADAYGRALTHDPGDPVTRLNLGGVRFLQGDIRAAEREYGRAIETAANFGAAYTGRGACRVQLGDLDGAKSDLDRAIALNPRDAKAHGNRADIHHERGDRKAERADLDRAIELDPGYARAWLNRGALRQETGDIAGALEDYAAATSGEARTAYRAHYSRARLRARSGAIKEALEDAGKAVELGPGDADTWVLRAQLRFDLEDSAGAIEDFRHALQMSPADWPRRAQVEGFLEYVKKNRK
jgi:serine/threonine-protein kinase